LSEDHGINAIVDEVPARLDIVLFQNNSNFISDDRNFVCVKLALLWFNVSWIIGYLSILI